MALARVIAVCFAVSVLLGSRAWAEEGGEPYVVSVLSYNVHGIFPLAAKDDPRDRMPTIGWLAHKYDIVLFQEDFEFHSKLVQQLRGDAVDYRGNSAWRSPHLAVMKILTFPLLVWIPSLSIPYGSGVSTFVDKDLHVPDSAVREAYGSCHGWVKYANDCFSAKGYLRVRIRTPEGAEVDVYNTHLEAGRRKGDAAVRREQMDALAEGIERLSAGRAVIVAGDLNTDYIRPKDRDMVRAFREKTGLLDSGAAPELSKWRERDFVLYRSGAGARLEVEAAGEALEFAGRQRALSDHAALYVNFQIEAVQ
jgi:endonuclease/exonuclease/phosphatase family metal-dependent hydrolase